VPLIVRWPGHVKAGWTDTTSVLTGVDWLPTLCKIAGAALPEDYAGDGEDRSSVLLGSPSQRSKAIFWYWPGGHDGNNWAFAAIREDRWKLLFSKDRRRLELYDIPEDRAETSNLADKHPEVVGKLRTKLEAWLAKLPDQPDPKCFSKLREK
jgi:N-acetylgalactosamine-6-sulfatase